MSATIIDGKKVASEVRKQIKEKVENLDPKPKLVNVLVGDDEPSKIYTRFKRNACLEVGMQNKVYELPTTNQEQLESLIDELNADETVTGILVQLPLPEDLDDVRVTNKISPMKDVDGLNVANIGKLAASKGRCLVPCTAKGILYLLHHYEIPIEGQHVVVVGRSNLVGRPVSWLLEHEHATVTLCHSRTRNLSDLTKQADILIAAVGRPHLIRADMVKPGAVVIDVGINRIEGKLVGDVDFEAVKEKASYITPVPGGVGPMTIAMLLDNVLEAWYLQHEKE